MKHLQTLKLRPLLGLLLGALLAVPQYLARADDVEIYFNPAPPNAPPPLVMLTLDWRPNLGSTYCNNANNASCRDKMGQEIYDALDLGPQIGGLYLTSQKVNLFQTFRAVFRLVFDGGAFDGMKIGLMMNHDDCLSGASCGGGSNGGYVLRGFELFEPDDANGAKQELLEIFKAIPTYADAPGSPEHKYQGRELFFELYRYLAGLSILNAHKGYADFKSGDVGRNLDNELFPSPNKKPMANCTAADVAALSLMTENQLNALSSTNPLLFERCINRASTSGSPRISRKLRWDASIETPAAPNGTKYISPFTDGDDWSCSGVYSINMLFQVSQQEDDSDNEIKKPLSEQGLALPSNGADRGFPPMISRLHNMDIAAGQATGVPKVDGVQNLTSYFLVDKVNTKTNEYASAGGTTNAIAALSDPRELLEALQGIAGQINSVSSSYVAVTVPVNADNRVTSLPHVFVALFQVDENGKPLWPGNVKKLDVVTTTLLDGSEQLDVKDALGNPAFNPVTGRINDDALTLWTVPTAADVAAADTTRGEISGRDGSSVRRGGAGHKIPGYRSGGVGLRNSDAGARQIFLEPESINPLALSGNALLPLDASDDPGALRENVDVQTRFGFRDTTVACDETDGTYCLSAIKEVLDAAAIAYPGSPSAAQKEAMAKNATQALLKWIRGIDVFDADADSSRTDTRRWLMGDVLHSRPVAINYGARPPGGSGYSEANQDVRLVFGANDGLMRMVRNSLAGASKPSAVTQQGDEYGEEVWAFMPRGLLSHVPRLAMTVTNVGVNRPYGVDGEPTLFTIDTNRDGIIDNDSSCTVGAEDCDRAWIYFGLRRGGKSYYALDVSNPDATAPKLMWKIDESAPGFSDLGMTFSTPRVGWVRFEDDPANQFNDPDDEPDLGNINVPVPVVIVGGGYHGHALTAGDHHVSGADSKDKLTYYGNDSGEGNAVFLVHARTGELVWKVTGGSGTDTATASFHADMTHGFAAAVAPMDADGDNILDRLYIPDTGGRVWRIDIPQYVPGVSPANHRALNWKATILANLRPADVAANPDDDLRFFHHATVVRRARDSMGVYDAIAVGSGDRAHPQSETNKNNWFFLFKDRLTRSGDAAVASRSPLVPSNLLNVTDNCFNGSSGGDSCTADQLEHGWRLALEENGEKNLSSPFIGGNGIIFTTYLPQGSGPDDDPCAPLGTSRLYQVGLDKGEPLRFLHSVVGDTFSKTDRWINLYSGIDGGVVAVSPEFWITASGKSGKNPPQKPVQFYWRESGVDTVK